MSKTDSDEKQLLERLRRGQPQAVQLWFKRYHQRLVRFFLQKVASQSDAEELAQETFINCLRHLALFRGESGIWTWMVSIARHEVNDYFRKKYAKKAINALPLSELLEQKTVVVHDAHQTAELVAAAIQQLRAEWRELLQLKYIDRKSVKEIAAELGRSIKAVEADLFRAREAFKVAYLALAALDVHA